MFYACHIGPKEAGQCGKVQIAKAITRSHSERGEKEKRGDIVLALSCSKPLPEQDLRGFLPGNSRPIGFHVIGI